MNLPLTLPLMSPIASPWITQCSWASWQPSRPTSQLQIDLDGKQMFIENVKAALKSLPLVFHKGFVFINLIALQCNYISKAFPHDQEGKNSKTREKNK